MLYSIIADSLVWNTGTWTLYKGSKTIFEREGPRQEQFTVLKDLPFTDTPDDFLVTKKSPDDMDFFELREYIDQVRRSGGEAFSYLADLHFKISYPFINLIVVLLGVALTTKVGRQGLARVFGVGITICFIYYLFAKLGLAFGHSGDIQPVLAAWLGNIVFLLFGLGLFVRTSR
jgi:lipopolysaccharide export system permease protein